MKTSKRQCDVENCERPHEAKGYCKLHYGRLKKTGSLARRSASDRFWPKADKSGDCWVWTSTKDRNGYGRFTQNGASRSAHRMAYELHYDQEAPPVLDHTCRRRDCVRPTHLRPTTQKQNTENRAANSSSSSGFRGVSWDKQNGKWKVKVSHFGRSYYGGLFVDLDNAVATAKELRNSLYTHNDADRIAA